MSDAVMVSILYGAVAMALAAYCDRLRTRCKKLQRVADGVMTLRRVRVMSNEMWDQFVDKDVYTAAVMRRVGDDLLDSARQFIEYTHTGDGVHEPRRIEGRIRIVRVGGQDSFNRRPGFSAYVPWRMVDHYDLKHPAGEQSAILDSLLGKWRAGDSRHGVRP